MHEHQLWSVTLSSSSYRNSYRRSPIIFLERNQARTAATPAHPANQRRSIVGFSRAKKMKRTAAPANPIACAVQNGAPFHGRMNPTRCPSFEAVVHTSPCLGLALITAFRLVRGARTSLIIIGPPPLLCLIDQVGHCDQGSTENDNRNDDRVDQEQHVLWDPARVDTGEVHTVIES